MLQNGFEKVVTFHYVLQTFFWKLKELFGTINIECRWWTKDIVAMVIGENKGIGFEIIC